MWKERRNLCEERSEVMPIVKDIVEKKKEEQNNSKEEITLTIYSIFEEYVWAELNENPDIDYKVYMQNAQTYELEQCITVVYDRKFRIENMVYKIFPISVRKVS